MEGATKLRMKIRNGYQKTPRLWEANSRAKELTVTLLPSKKTVDVTLEDKSDWQEIAVEQPAGAFEAVELKVKSVYAGKKYDDLCISDVQLFVTATSSDNPAFEKQRAREDRHLEEGARRRREDVQDQARPVAADRAPVRVSHLGRAGRRRCGPSPRARTEAACRMSHGLARAAQLRRKGKHAAGARNGARADDARSSPP